MRTTTFGMRVRAKHFGSSRQKTNNAELAVIEDYKNIIDEADFRKLSTLISQMSGFRKQDIEYLSKGDLIRFMKKNPTFFEGTFVLKDACDEAISNRLASFAHRVRDARKELVRLLKLFPQHSCAEAFVKELSDALPKEEA